ncbi:MAG: hypothetical protein U0271_32190 [Polyangiaceae bacterium]
MSAFIFLPMVLGVLVLAMVAIGSLIARSSQGPNVSAARGKALVELFRARGADGAGPYSGGPLTLLAHGAPVRVIATNFTKSGPNRIWIGTSQPTPDPNYAFRGAGRGRDKRSELPRVRVRPETSLDRIGKALGLNREPDTGYAELDRYCYIETANADETVLALLREPEMIELARTTMQLGDAFVAINEEGDALGVSVRTYGRLVEPAALDQVLAALARARQVLPETELPPSKARTLHPVFTIMMSFGAVFVLAGTAIVLQQWAPVGPSFARVAAAAGLAVLAVWVIIGFFTSRGRPRGLARFLTIAAVGLLFVPGVVAASLTLVNGAGDTSSETVPVTVVGRRTTTSKNSTTYYLNVVSDAPRGLSGEVKVTSQQFGRLPNGSRAALKVGKGRLGYPWMRDIKPN